MKKAFVIIVALLAIVYTSQSLFKADAYGPVQVSLSSFFDDENNNIQSTFTETYGSSIALDSYLDESEYNFAFWVINGIVRKELPKDYLFTVTSSMDMKAIFSPINQHAVVFMDANGKLIEVQYVNDGQAAQDIETNLPSKPGHEIATPKWDYPIDVITSDTVRVLQYIKTNQITYTITVINSERSGEYAFNEIVSLQASDTFEGNTFQYWTLDGTVVSYNLYYSFTVVSHSELEAVYGTESLFQLPTVTISNDLMLRDQYRSYMGQFYVPEGFELIEYGMITSQLDEDITLESLNITRYQGLKHVGRTKEWLMSIAETSHTYARAYMIIKNSQQELATFYSLLQQEPHMYTEDFANFVGSGTTYVSETFTGNHGIEWTVTDSRKNLGGYDIDGGGIMFRVPGVISATIPEGVISLSLDMRMGFTGGTPSDRTVEIHINGQKVGERTLQTTDQVETLVLDNLDVEDSFLLEIKATGVSSRQITVNNLVWASHTLFTSDRYLLQLEANKDTQPTVDIAGPFYENNTLLTLTAPNITDYTFSHWENAVTNQFESDLQNYSFAITKHTHLRAVYVDFDDSLYHVNLETNIAGDTVSKSEEGPFALNDQVTLNAEAVMGYEFIYWQNMKTNQVLSYDHVYVHTIKESLLIRAMYQSDATPYYYTDFNDVTKTSYTVDQRVSYGQTLTLDNTLIAGTSPDRYANVRPGGFIRFDFEMDAPTSFSFEYLLNSDTAQSGYLLLQYSTDTLQWTTLDDAVVAPHVDRLTYRFDIQLFNLWANKDLDQGDTLYFRLYNLYPNDNVFIYDVTIEAYENFIGFPLRDYESPTLTFNHLETIDNVYSLGDTWIPTPCVAVDSVLGSMDCEREGTVNTDERGYYDITYTAIDSHGTLVKHTITKVVMRDASLLDVALDPYYANAQGLYGESLMLALRSIIRDVSYRSYGEARYDLQVTDVDPNNPNNLIIIYLRNSVLKDWDEGVTWNREHVWPVSRMPILRPGNSNRDMGSDLHNLVPANPSENTSRGFKHFSEVASTVSYVPHDDVKGDVARMMFYMITMYDILNLSNTPAASEYQMGELDYLVAWHFTFTVRPFEIHRNNMIFSFQNNRNPFIDHPELVELLFFDHPNIPVS